MEKTFIREYLIPYIMKYYTAIKNVLNYAC